VTRSVERVAVTCLAILYSRISVRNDGREFIVELFSSDKMASEGHAARNGKGLYDVIVEGKYSRLRLYAPQFF
jgi:hypothetical protein